MHVGVLLMAKILITSGPTRQYIDPVRFLSNASSGQMGCSIAEQAIATGHSVTIVSGPVHVDYPARATVIPVVTTQQMLAACRKQFPECDGLIGVAAPCDYRPHIVADRKIKKTGQPITLELIETPDIVATLSAEKQPHQWVVGFALETHDARFQALAKLQRKRCDMVVVNGPQAMSSDENSVEIIDHSGDVIGAANGNKDEVADVIMNQIQLRLIETAATCPKTGD